MSLIQPSEEHEIIEHSVSQLARKYAGKFDASEIRPVVQESYMGFADARVRTFIPVFTTRYADDRLRAMAKVRGLINDALPSVLFVCVHNAGRSQMAAGWLRALSKGRVEVYSGGSLPGKDLNAAAIEAMRDDALVGTATQAADKMRALSASLDLDELVVCTWVHDPVVQLRSFELLSQVFSLNTRALKQPEDALA